MKCAFFFLIALLSALALSSATSSVLSPPFATIDTSPVVTSNPQLAWYTDNKYVNGEDLLAGLAAKTGANVTWSVAPYSNASTSEGGFANINADDGPVPNMQGRYAVDLRIGRNPTHVGTFRGKRLYNRIYSMLKDCCIANHDPSILGYCETTRPECNEQCHLFNVVYSNGHSTYRSDSTASLTVHYSYFNDKDHPGIQDLAFRMVAKIYQTMADDNNNCAYWHFPGTRRTIICYVASKLELAFATNGGPILGVLNVELTWNKDTPDNTFHCATSLNAIDALMWGENRDSLAGIMKWPKDKILPFTFCADSPCFKQRLKIQEQWYEGSGCKRPQWPNGCHPGSEKNSPDLNCPPVQ
ncbi:hypothetical protein CFE70_004745 [Pyrenophora teres f. teres 0-1]|uniref:Uncharacterized protein n=1 Tax=Pyrenophora teres f. teres (strain 0-1) TaxID=861557 RepID=E3RRY6_PYRTT|nr:hypothetical protein PTT_11629 [Pyrenophora teres f. teres 0-1]